MSNATFDFDSSHNLGIEASLLGDDSQPFDLEGASRSQTLLSPSTPQLKAASIVGTSGDDRLRGTGKADTIDGAAGNDILLGRNGNDVLLGQRGRDRAKGGTGKDILEGAGGSDRLLGNDGNDTIVGAGGKDNIRGGAGNDQVATGRGRDTVLLTSGEGTDTITDFTLGKDQIKLLKKLTFADLTIAASGRRDSSISVTRTGEVLAILKGIRPDQLSATDFGEEPQVALNAQDDAFKVREGGVAAELPKGVNSLLANDQGELLTLDTTPVRGPEHGTVELLLDGRFVYRHDGSEASSDSFRYRVIDGNGNADTATVQITVNPINDAPVGVEETAVVAKGGTTALLESGATTVLANDTDPEDSSLSAELVDVPRYASNFQLNPDGSFTYTHDGSQNLSDRFTYQATDGDKKSGVVTVNITVTPSSGNAPVAVDDQITVKEGGTVTQLVGGATRLTGNDTDLDLPGDVLKMSIVPVTAPAHGTLQLKSDGTFSYTHDGSENLSDSFVYEVRDSSGQSDTATAFITITPVNEQPAIGTNAALTVQEGDRGTIDTSKLGATDVDSNPAALVYTVTGTPTHGRLELTAKPGVAITSFAQADIDANRLVYVHNNSNTTSDRFTFELSDGGKDGTKPVSGTFNIQITPVIDLPVAVTDAISVDQGNEATLLVSGATTVLANDTLGEAETLTALLVSEPKYGTLTLNDDGTFSYIHDGSENFEDSFTYQVSDGTNLSEPVEVAIAITPFNKAPVNIVPGQQTISPNTSLLFTQERGNLIGVSDPDAGATPVQVRLRISAGTLTLSGVAGLTFITGDGLRDPEIVVRGSIDSINAALDGLLYTPPRGFVGTALLSLTTNDLGNTGSGGALLDADTVEIVVGSASDINDAPVNTVPGNQTTAQDTNLVFQTSGGNAIQISDPDAGTNPVQVQLSVTSGSLSLSKVTGLSFLQGDGVNDATLSFTGSITDINAALNGLTYIPNNTFKGTATLTIQTNDQGNTGLGNPLVDEDQVAIVVTRVNKSPIAQNDVVATAEDTPVEIAVLSNDSDSDGSLDLTSVAIATDSTNGTLTIDPTTGVITYTPDPNFNGTDSFSYTVTDNEGLVSDPATVSITVTPVNDKPLAVADSATTDEDTPIDINILNNDTDPDGNTSIDPSSILITQDPANGTLSIDPTTGVVTYSPNPNFNGTDSFSYTVADADGLVSDPATVSITVTSVDRQPDAVDDVATTDEDTPVDINILDNDTDPDGNTSIDPSSILITQDPANGTLSIDPATGVVTYSPNPNFNGTDSFSYTVADADGLVSDPATVSITVTPVNDKPLAVADSATTDEDTPIDINILNNDTDPDGNTSIDPSSILITQDPANGTLSIDPATGVVTYSPNPNFNGTDSFSYTVADADGLVSDPATVSITVTPVNDKPLAVADSATTDEDTPVDINILNNDTDPDGNTSIDPSSILITQDPANGTLSIDPATGVVTYSPNPNFNGTDSFSYTVADADGLVSDPATVSITVTPVNDKPLAVADSATTDEDTPVDINILNNDTDPDGNTSIDPSSILITQDPANGTLSIDPTTGVVTYSPNPNFNGTDSFSYTVADADGLVSDPATVSITVTPVNGQPTAQDDSVQTNQNQPIVINVLANDSDLDGTIDPTSVVAGDPQNGTVAVNPTTGEITYNPGPGFTGIDSFTYTVEDNEGGLSNVATVTIQVGGVPDAVDDVATTAEDTPVDINILDNDTDPDGNTSIDPSSILITQDPANGTLSIDPATGVVTYSPNPNFNGTDSFSYTVADADGLVSDPATVSITVTPVNDKPLAVADSATTDEDTPVDINILNNDTDPDGNTSIDPSSILITQDPANGTLSIDPATGVVTYSPNPNFNGTDSFSYTVADTDGLVSDPATVSITVTPVNDKPLAVADSATTDEDTPIDINILNNDTDPDGNTSIDPSSILITQDPANGTLSIDPTTGVVTYSPNPNFNGSDSFSYTVADTDGLVSDPATVSITVTPVNDKPLAVADSATTDEDTPVDINILNNDTDPDGNTSIDPSSILITQDPANGTLSIDPTTGVVTYSPNPNFNGTDSFSYTVADADGLVSAPATVSITVTPVNDQPIARDDTFTTSIDVTLSGNLLANNGNGADTDPDNDSLSVTEINGAVFTAGSPITLPSGATLTVNADGTFTYLSNATIPTGGNETDSFTYTISDGQGGTSTATANLTISGSNNSPIANNDDFETNEETAVNGNLFNNNSNGIDSDPDGDLFTVTAINGAAANVGQVVTLASGALVTVNADGTFGYDPNGAFNDLAQGAIATDTFTYTITDSKGKSDIATVSIQVTGLNDNPVGVSDTATTSEDTAIAINVLANDTDPDTGDTVQISSIDPTGTKGQLIITADNQIFYDPRGHFDELAVGETATDTFTYNVIDSSGAVSTATVTVTITGVNDSPVVRKDSVSTAVGQPVVINVLANDSDIDGTINPASIQISANPDPAKGSVTVNADGTITYTPKPGVTTSDSFTYTVRDNTGAISTSAASVDVFIVNLTGDPVANGDSIEINEGETATINLIGNDIDNGSIDPDSIVITNNPAFGTLAINGDGTVTYTPNNPNFNGVDGFNYQVSDNQGNLSNVSTVSITINAVNDAPINTLPSNVTTTEDTPLTFSGANQISVNDVDITNPNTTELTVTLSVTSGSLTLGTASGISFPNGGDGIGDASITFKGSLNAINTALSGLTYDPAANFSGDVTLVMTTSDRISDTQGSFGSGGPKATTNSLVITVESGNDTPRAQDDLFTTDEDTSLAGNVLQNNGNGRDRDPDGDPISVAEVNGSAAAVDTPLTLPSGATLILNRDGTFTYNPNGAFDNLLVGQQGTDSFEYTISDGNGGTDTATVTITIDGRNDAPIIGTNTGATVKQGSDVILTNSMLREADPDSNGVNVTYVVSTSPGDGRLAFVDDLATAITEFTQADINANRVVYVHTADSVEPDSFEFSLRDQAGLTSTSATFAINITTVNVAPVLDLDADNSSGATGADYAGRFNQGGGRVAIADNDLSITDNDDSTLASMIVTLTNRPDGDPNESLSLNNAAQTIATEAGITVAYNAATGELTLTGKAAISQYESILKGVRYNNTVLNDTANRTITVTLDDGFDGGTTTATSILSINLAPTAGNDTYAGESAAVGNTRFTVGSKIGGATSPEMVIATGNILSNDSDANNDALSVTPVANGSTTSGGTFTLNADGTFSYLPPVGFTGTDSFTYTVTDEFGASATGTVSISVDDLVWYVNSGAASGGSGYYDSAFRTLAEAQAAAGEGAYFYVYGGNQSINGFTLENNQSLIGSGADLTVSNNRTLLGATGAVTISNNNGDAIILGQNNTIRGLTISAGGFAIRDAGSSVGTLIVDNVTLEGGFRTQAGGTLDVSLNGLLGSELVLKGVGGSFTATDVLLAAEGLSPVQLENNTANISLQTVDIQATDAAAISSINGGNLTVANGDIALFDFNQPNENAIDIRQSSGTATVTLTNLAISFLDLDDGLTGAGIFAGSSNSATLNLNLLNNSFRDAGFTGIQVVQGGSSILALKDFVGDGTITAQVQTYLSNRNTNTTVVAVPGTDGFTNF